MTDRFAVRLLISGMVQGVGYRYWTVGEARRLGLHGWVRNLTDGRVEILAFGARERIGELEEACRAGPPSARVIQVVRGPAVDDGSEGFFERPTETANG